MSKNVMIAPFVAHSIFHGQRLKPSRKGASLYKAKHHQQSQQHKIENTLFTEVIYNLR